jgi:tetratricopeptide (TPR) repeat protein
MSRRLDNWDWQARILNSLAVAQRQAGDFTESMTLLRTSLEMAQRIGNEDIESKALGNLAVLHHDLGDFEQAASAAERSMQINSAHGDDWAVAIDRVNYTAALVRSGDAETAAGRLAEWMPSMLVFAGTELMTDVIEVGGAIASELGRPRVAAQLLAAADARRAEAGMPRTAAEAGRVDLWVTTARHSMSAADWRDAYNRAPTSDPSQIEAAICSLASGEPGG